MAALQVAEAVAAVAAAVAAAVPAAVAAVVAAVAAVAAAGAVAAGAAGAVDPAVAAMAAVAVASTVQVKEGCLAASTGSVLEAGFFSQVLGQKSRQYNGACLGFSKTQTLQLRKGTVIRNRIVCLS